jgi:hypothetical protein
MLVSAPHPGDLDARCKPGESGAKPHELRHSYYTFLMSCLHTGYRRLTGTALLVALVLLPALIAPAGAAPFGGPRYTVDCALDIQRSADPNAYYLQIGFDSAAAPDIAMQVRGRLLRIQVRQGADRQAAACRTRFYKSLTLPRDADARRIQRQDEPGRVLIIIPRREPGWR